MAAACGLLLLPAVAAAQFPGPDEWYVRLVVSSGSLVDDGNLLGRITGGADGHDGYDLEEMPATFPPYLTLVFPHPDWGPDAGDYTVDYRQARPGATGDWAFEARSDSVRTITISWQVVAPAGSTLLARSTLVDEGTGGSVRPLPGGSYSVTMVGTVHAFRWLVNAEPVVSAGADSLLEAGQVLSLPPATFADEDDDDQHAATVDWGDGAVVPGVVNQQAQTVGASHVFAAIGTYPVEVCVTDGGGASGCDALTAFVDCAPGDVDGHGGIVAADLPALVAHLLGTPSPCPDVTGDGAVDAADLAAEAVLVWQWQVPPPPGRGP